MAHRNVASCFLGLYEFTSYPLIFLSDMFDPVVSPFKVPMDVVMAFIKNGFESGSESLQRQTLTWLQVCDVVVASYMTYRIHLCALGG